jgi:hypothetical protein
LIDGIGWAAKALPLNKNAKSARKRMSKKDSISPVGRARH